MLELITKNDIETIEKKLDQILNNLSVKRTESDTVYSTQELAEFLHVSTKTVQFWRNTGLIEFSKVHNKIFYTQESVLSFIQRHSIKSRFKL